VALAIRRLGRDVLNMGHLDVSVRAKAAYLLEA
jgi:hypothetical protein